MTKEPTTEPTGKTDEEKALATTGGPDSAIAGFQDEAGYEFLKKQAQMLASSDMVPMAYRQKPANCVVALEMASRTGASPLAVMQNLHIIKGKPSWGSAFIIGVINSVKKADGTRKFSDLRFVIGGKEGTDTWSCFAVATELESGDVLEGPPVTITMAKAEGWYGKDGSKWKTMPALMLRYRAAAFFGRLYAPEILMGMFSQEEAKDITDKADVFIEVAPEDGTHAGNIVKGAQESEEPAKEPIDGELI
ncbi:MAG: hypothetical protein KAJ07_00535 [Planctomycetes bacterium]|nr:hypothetical protein [Planctomycetota bacterium]